MEKLTWKNAGIIEGEGEGPSLNDILRSFGLPDLPVKVVAGYTVQSAVGLLEDVARATRVYRFDDELKNARFFNCFEDARAYAKSKRYSVVAYDSETDKWSVDLLVTNENKNSK